MACSNLGTFGRVPRWWACNAVVFPSRFDLFSNKQRATAGAAAPTATKQKSTSSEGGEEKSCIGMAERAAAKGKEGGKKSLLTWGTGSTHRRLAGCFETVSLLRRRPLRRRVSFYLERGPLSSSRGACSLYSRSPPHETTLFETPPPRAPAPARGKISAAPP